MISTCSNPDCGNYFEPGPARLRAIAMQNSSSYMLVWMCDECSRSLETQTNGLFSPLIAPRNDQWIRASA